MATTKLDTLTPEMDSFKDFIFRSWIQIFLENGQKLLKKANMYIFWHFKKQSIEHRKTLESHCKVHIFLKLSIAASVKFTVLEKSWKFVWIIDLGGSKNKISLESLQNYKYATSELQY